MAAAPLSSAAPQARCCAASCSCVGGGSAAASPRQPMRPPPPSQPRMPPSHTCAQENTNWLAVTILYGSPVLVRICAARAHALSVDQPHLRDSKTPPEGCAT